MKITYAVRYILGCVPDIWDAICSQIGNRMTVKKQFYLFLYILVCVFVVVILTKEQNIIIWFQRKKSFDL